MTATLNATPRVVSTTFRAAAAALREESFEGRLHLVAPVVALVEGVHNGALYPADEIGKYVGAWNGVPLPIFHPKDASGGYLSANTPQIIEDQSVGRFFNAWFDDAEHKLKGEIWVDIEKAEEMAPEVLAMIRCGAPLEVSTSLWDDDVHRSGEWNGEHYDAVITNIRPDHLALLPGGKGACSWQDGCGVRANARSSARRPSFSGTETRSWAEVDKGFGAYVAAYYKAHGGKPKEGAVTSVKEAPAAMKRWIASHTLMGDPAADNERDLMMFPVVGPNGKLNEGACRAVMGGRGAQAKIPDAARESARRMARMLLKKHFHMDMPEGNEEDAPGLMGRLVRGIANALGIATEEESRETVRSKLVEALEEMSHEDLRRKLSDALQAAMPHHMHYIRDVYEDRFVYEMSENMVGHVGPAELYEQQYKVGDDGEVELVGEAAEVKEERRYVPVAAEAAPPGTAPVAAERENENMKKDEAIKALIADKRTKLEEGDREWLSGLSEEQLGRLVPAACPEIPPAPPPTPAPKPPATAEEYVGAAPAEIRTVLSRALADQRARKDELVKAILANERNRFGEEQLRAKDLDELDALAELAQAEVSFAGQAGAPRRVAEVGAPEPLKVFEKV